MFVGVYTLYSLDSSLWQLENPPTMAARDQFPEDEDLAQTATCDEELVDMIQQWNLENADRDVVAVVAGKSGTGKSTLINNFLTLDRNVAAENRLKPTSVTDDVKVYNGKLNDVRIRAVDMPGLHARRQNRDTEKNVIAALSHHTKGNADILIYCVSLTQRLDSIDEKNIGTLIKAFGKKIWDNAIFVLTHADSVLEDEENASKLDGLVDEFVKELQEVLAELEVEACVKPFSSGHISESPSSEVAPDPPVEFEVAPESSLKTEASQHDTGIPATTPDTNKEVIAIPTGKKPNKPPAWRESLLAQVITLCQSRAISKLTQLEGISMEKIMKSLKKGAKMGTAAGAVGGASGAALGPRILAFIGSRLELAIAIRSGTAAGLVGVLAGGVGVGVLLALTGALASAYNNDLFKDVIFYYQVQQKLKELQKEGQK